MDKNAFHCSEIHKIHYNVLKKNLKLMKLQINCTNITWEAAYRDISISSFMFLQGYNFAQTVHSAQQQMNALHEIHCLKFALCEKNSSRSQQSQFLSFVH